MRLAVTALKIAVSVTLLWLLFHNIALAPLIADLKRVRAGSVALVMALGFAQIFLFAARWQRVGRTGAAEAKVLLRYLNGAPTWTMTSAPTDGLARAGLVPLGLSPWMLRHPSLMALAEPPANRRATRWRKCFIWPRR